MLAHGFLQYLLIGVHESILCLLCGAKCYFKIVRKKINKNLKIKMEFHLQVYHRLFGNKNLFLVYHLR